MTIHAEPGNDLHQETQPPQTLKGLKRQATKIKKARGIRHMEALEIVAQSMGYSSYKSALKDLGDAALEPCQ